MAPKTKVRGDGRDKELRQPSNDTRFVSQAAKERYENFANKTRVFIKERGMSFIHNVRGISDKIPTLGWQTFCKEPSASSVGSVVKEFYANVPESVDGRTMVRGKEIIFDAATINQFYGLPHIGDDEDAYLAYKQTVDYNEVIRALADVEVTWIIAVGEQVRIESKYLESSAWIW